MIASCCLDRSDGRLRKKIKSLKPPLPLTDFAHPSCYLRGTNDCSQDISREHYVSANVLGYLAQAGKTVTISGAPFLASGETKELAIGNLASKILCKRHNEALAPLDQEAGIFFRSLGETLADLDRTSTSRKLNLHLASGTALELWMLKVACGIYFSRIASADKLCLSDSHTLDLSKVIEAFFNDEWDEKGGLYFNGHSGTMMTTAFHVQIAPLTDLAKKAFCGARISLLGFECDLIFDTTGADPGEWTGVVRRPSELIFEQNNRRRYLLLTWAKGVPEASVHFDTDPRR